MDNLFKKDFSEKEIVNFILMVTITLMPLMVIKDVDSPFMYGKLGYLYTVGFLFLIYFFIRMKTFEFKIEEKVTLVFLISLIISTVKSIEPAYSLFGEDGWEQGLLMYIVYLLLFVVAINIFKLSKNKLNIMCIASCIMGIHTIFQFYGVDIILKYYLKVEKYVGLDAVIGTIGQRNLIAQYILVFSLISISLYIFTDDRRFLIYSLILFAALLATTTRGAWVGLAIALTIGFIMIFKEKKYYKKILIIMLSFIFIFFIMNIAKEKNMLVERVETIVEDTKNIKDSESGTGRIGIWKAALKCVEINPIFGSGIDTLRIKSALNGIDGTLGFTKAHNEFIDYAVWGGIFTLGSYLALIGIILKKLLDIREDNVAKGFIVVIVGYLAQSFFSISVIEVAPIYWIILGAAVGYYRSVSKKKSVAVE